MTPVEIEKIFRDEAGRALATLIRLVGDFDLAEDGLQEAFAVGAGALACSGRAVQPAGVAGQCRTQQGDRPHPPANHPARQAGRTRRTRCCSAAPALRRRRRRRARRRHAAADLHLLPSGVRGRGPGRADAAHGVRADHRRGGPRLSRQRGCDGAAAGPRQAEDPARRHSLRGAGPRSAGAAAARRARGHLSRLHRGLCGHRRRGFDAAESGARGDPAGSPARCADAAAGRDQGAAGADAAARRPPRLARHRGRRHRAAGRTGSRRGGIPARSPKA